jgi:hypothetical protein
MYKTEAAARGVVLQKEIMRLRRRIADMDDSAQLSERNRQRAERQLRQARNAIHTL